MDLLLMVRENEGEQIEQIAHQLPRIPLGSFSRTIQAISYLLFALATIIVFLRIYVRWFPVSGSRQTWGYDDIFAVSGWVPLAPALVFLILATEWGLGAHDSQVPDGMIVYYRARVKEYMFYFEMIYFGSSVLTKLAMAIMIMRLTTTKLYAYIIWGNMCVLALNAGVCLIVMFVSCSPVPALWNEKLGFCRIKNGWIIVSYVGSVVLAMVDWTCAITPFFILQGLQMPRRRKVSVQIILSLGIFGSAAGLVRMGYYYAYDSDTYPNESLYNWGHTILWSMFEAGLGCIACSLPPLRVLFKRFYKSSSGASGKKSGLATGDAGIQLSSLGKTENGGLSGLRRKEGSQWGRLDDEQSTSSQQQIIKSTQISVETSSIDVGKANEAKGHHDYHWREDV